MPQHICPTADSLRNFAVGRCPDAEYESIAQHVETCSICLSQLEILDQSADPLTDQLHKLSTASVHPTNDQEVGWADAVLLGRARSGSFVPSNRFRRSSVGREEFGVAPK